MSRLQRRAIAPRLADESAERARRAHEDRLNELQSLPLANSRVIKDVTLASGTNTPVPHGMGRRVSVLCSPPRGGSSTGRIQEVRTLGATYDPRHYVVMLATGWGASIDVDLVVF